MNPIRSATLVALLLLSTCSVVKAQEYTYEFNANGELQKGAPAVLLANSTVWLKIAFDTTLFMNQVHTVQLNVLNALIFWKERYAVLNGMDPKPDFLPSIDTLIGDLQTLYNAFNGKNMAGLLAMAPDHFCGIQPTKKADTTKADSVFKYTPSPRMIIAGLCRQFRAVMRCAGKDCKAEIPLCLGKNCCTDLTVSGSCTAISEDAVIDLYKLDALKGLTIDWYNSNIQYFDYLSITFLDHLINNDPAYKNITDFFSNNKKLVPSKLPDTACARIKKKLDSLEDGWTRSLAKQYDDGQVSIKAYSWILRFAWLNKVAFNPFGFTNAELYRPVKSPAEKDAKKRDVDTIALNQVDSFLVKKLPASPELKDVKLYLDILAKRDSIKTRVDSVATAKTKDTQTSSGKSETANQQSLLAFEQVGVLRNRVVTLLSYRKDSLFKIRNYYYNKDVDKRKFVYELPDNERVILAIHNLPGPDTIRLSSNVVAYNEQTTIAQTGLAALQGVTSIPKGEIGDLEQYKAFLAAGIPSKASDSTLNTVADCKTDVDNKIKDLHKKIRRYEVFDSIYSTNQLPPLALQKIYPDSAQLKTRNLMPDGGIKAPFEEDYKLYVKDTGKTAALTLLDSSFYKIRRRRLAELALGFSYSISYERQVNLDSANSSYNVKNVENKLQTVVGLKLHLLRKIYWGNDHLIFTKGACDWGTISERLSLFLGVSLPDPTNYLYSGVGVDLIPGLNINGGVQWYKYHQYTIANNAILDQSTIYKPGYYVSVTTDPILLVTIITTFFK